MVTTIEPLIGMLMLFPGGRLGLLCIGVAVSAPMGGTQTVLGRWLPFWRLAVGGQFGKERSNRRWVSVDQVPFSAHLPV